MTRALRYTPCQNSGGVLGCPFLDQCLLKVSSGADIDAIACHVRKIQPKPWLQYIRGSDGERSPISSALKKTESLIWGGGGMLSPDIFRSEMLGTPFSITSSYVLESWFWLELPNMLWHYYLHQTKLFKDLN